MNLLFYGYYLAEKGVKYREVDWAAVKIKQWVKGEDIKGSFTIPLASGKTRTFKSDDRQEFFAGLWQGMSKRITKDLSRPHAIIPIPGHKIVAAHQGAYRTLRYAQAIAAKSDGLLIAEDALRWISERDPQRGTSGWRSPDPRFDNLAVRRKVDLPCILFDDVCTSGSSLAAARWRLVDAGCRVVSAAVVMRPTHEPLSRMVGWHEEQAPEFARPLF